MRWLPDEAYLKVLYYFKMGEKLDLNNPKTFNQKLQWLKLNDHKDIYTTMVDKFAVKQYVASLIGSQYVIPTLAVYDKVEDIVPEALPNEFVLKTTHGGGGRRVMICRDKSAFDWTKAKRRLKDSLRSDIYRNMREWPYKNVQKRIIAEQLLKTANGKSPNDYKFYCFDGKADCVMVCVGRDEGVKFYFFDKNWNLRPFNNVGKNAEKGFTIPKPEGIDEMFAVAEKLSVGLPHVRVDLYYEGGKIYFGELTFFTASGFDRGLTTEADEYFGNLINLKK